MDKPTSKRCSGCGESLPIEQYGKNAAMKDGRQIHCKPCRADIQRAYRARNPDKAREITRQTMRRRRQADPDADREYMRNWREQNPELVKASKRAWEAANRDRIRIYASEANRRWKRANPDKVKAEDLRRRALKASASVGLVDLAALWESQGGVCGICDLPIDRDLAWPDPRSASVDHIMPLARGGAHAQFNLQWVHLTENLSKGARLPE